MRIRFIFGFAAAFMFLLSGLIISSCKHEPPLKLSAEDSAICFERDILPIFVSNCAKSGCHDPITAEEDVVLNTWAGIMDAGVKPGKPQDSKVYEELSTGDMSKAKYGNLNQSQKDIIKKWIILGAKNTTNCPTTCDSSKFTFSGDINPMIQKLCVGCHNSSSASGSVDLSTHAKVQVVANNGKLLSSMKRTVNWMPQGGKKLSDCEIRQFEKWINAGAPNN